MLASEGFKTTHFFIVLVVLLIACNPKDTEPSPAGLELVPASSYPEKQQVIEVISDFDLTACHNIRSSNGTISENATDHMYFRLPDSQKPQPLITVEQILTLHDSQARMMISIDAETPEGKYEFVLNCTNKRQFIGNFIIETYATPHSLLVSPASANAEGENIPVTLSLPTAAQTEANRFIQGISKVIFQSDAKITTRQAKVAEDGWSITADIIVSPLSLQEGESERLISVAVITGTLIFRGQLQILAGHMPVIEISPNSISRPANGEGSIDKLISISSSNFDLLETDAIGNLPEIVFSGHPGVSIQEVNVLDSEQMTCTIRVDEGAYLGAGVVTVRNDTREADTQLYILPSVGDKSVRIHPAAIEGCYSPSACQPQLLVANAIGANFNANTVVTSDSTDITIGKQKVISDTAIVLWIEVAPFSTPEAIALTFSTDSTSIKSYVFASAGYGHRLEKISDFTQGDIDDVNLWTEKGVMSNSSNVHIPSHTGTWYESEIPVSGDSGDNTIEGVVIRKMQIAEDAPTGPALVEIVGTDEHLRTYFTISPSEDIPWASLEPDLIWLSKKQHQLRITAPASWVLDDNTVVESGDPCITVTSSTPDADNSSENALMIRLQSSAFCDAGIGVLYICNNTDCAAVSYIKSNTNYTTNEQANFGTLYRSAGVGKVTVPLPKSFDDASSIAADIFDGINVSIESVSTSSYDNSVHVILSLDEDGPSGWIGLVIRQRNKQFVFPVKIANDDSSLEDSTQDLLSATIISTTDLGAGEIDTTVLVNLPPILTEQEPPIQFNQHSTEVYSLSPFIAANSVAMNAESQSTMELNISSKYISSGPTTFPGFPIAITTTRGAAIAMLPTPAPENEQTISINETFQKVYTPDSNLRMNVTFDEPTTGLAQLLFMSGSDQSESSAKLNVNYVDSTGSLSLGGFENQHLFGAENNSFVIWGSAEGNTRFNISNLGEIGSKISSDEICETPMLFIGKVDSGGYLKNIDISGTSQCRLQLSVNAKKLVNRAFLTPDMKLSNCTLPTSCYLLSKSDAANGSRDPLYYMDFAGIPETLTIEPQYGTVGFYVVNVRQPIVIRRVSRAEDNTYIELEMEAGTNMDDCTLTRRDPDNGVPLATLALSGTVPNTRQVYIAAATHAYTTVADTAGVADFSSNDNIFVEISCNNATKDSVQIGGNYDIDGAQEGYAFIAENYFCFERVGRNIDTNNNRLDFYGRHQCVPE